MSQYTRRATIRPVRRANLAGKFGARLDVSQDGLLGSFEILKEYFPGSLDMLEIILRSSYSVMK